MHSDIGIDECRVGDLIVDFVRHEVRREDIILPVKGLSFELLACLIRHHPELATLRQINEEVWGENVVTPAALSQRVKLLREGLGSSDEYAQYIEVVKTRGYRLVVPVEFSESSQSLPASTPPRISQLGYYVIAVIVIALLVYLGIETFGKDSQQAALVDTRQVTDDLADRARELGVSEEAYDLYSRATYHGRAYSVAEIQKGIQLLDRALELEPNFANAMGMRASLYAFSGTPSYGWLTPDEAFRRAREDALRAIALDPTLDWVLVVLGDIILWHEWNAEAAEQVYRKALAANPQSTGARFSLAYLMGALGRHDEAIRLALEGVEIQPLRGGSYTNLGWRFIGARRFEEAIAAANRALELEPGMMDAILVKIWGHTYLKQYEQAIELAELAGSTSVSGYALAMAGRTEAAREVLVDLMDKPEGEEILADEVATIQIGLGDYESALDWLEKALEQRSRTMLFLKVTAVFDPLRKFPRFQSIQDKVGLWSSEEKSSVTD